MAATLIATRAQARLFWVLFRRDLGVQYAWLAWSLPFEALNLVAGLVVWLFFARAFGGQAPFLQAYGGDIVAYLILGMAVTPLLLQTMEQFYGQVKSLYTGSWSSSGVRLSMAEYLAMAKIPLWTYLSAQMFWGYVQQFIYFAVYFVAGAWWFGFHTHPGARYDLALLALVLGLLASAGIGLIAASMVWLMNAWHGTEPIHWLVAVLVPLVSGAYFPPSILPHWLRVISAWLPQTYSLDAIRRSVLGTDSAGSSVRSDLLLLSMFAVILLVFGSTLLGRP
jgi:ABC-2 type transport system permease protein